MSSEFTPGQRAVIEEMYTSIEEGHPRHRLDQIVKTWGAPTAVEFSILKEVYLLLHEPRKLRANREDILALVGSWGDTLEDSEVLDGLRSIRNTGRFWQETIAGR